MNLAINILAVDLWMATGEGLLYFTLDGPTGYSQVFQLVAVREVEGKHQARYVSDAVSKPDCRGLADALVREDARWRLAVFPSAEEIAAMMKAGGEGENAQGSL